MAETRLPNSVGLDFVEGLYADYLRDPQSVSPDWREYFQALSGGNGSPQPETQAPAFKPWSIFNPPSTAFAHGNGAATEEATTAVLQERVDQLIRNYRVRGHMAAQLDPLGIPRAKP